MYKLIRCHIGSGMEVIGRNLTEEKIIKYIIKLNKVCPWTEYYIATPMTEEDIMESRRAELIKRLESAEMACIKRKDGKTPNDMPINELEEICVWLENKGIIKKEEDK